MTVLVAIWFVLVTLKPDWVRGLGASGGDSGWGAIGLTEAGRTDLGSSGVGSVAPGSFSLAAKVECLFD